MSFCAAVPHATPAAAGRSARARSAGARESDFFCRNGDPEWQAAPAHSAGIQAGSTA